MSPRALVGIVAIAAPLALVGAVVTIWTLVTVGLAGGAAILGFSTVVPGGLVVIAWLHRRELLAERDAADLAAANEREDRISYGR